MAIGLGRPTAMRKMLLAAAALVGLAGLAACTPLPSSPVLKPKPTAPAPKPKPAPKPVPQTVRLNGAVGSTTTSTWDVYVESNQTCHLLDFEVNGKALKWIPARPAVGQACSGSNGLYLTTARFDVRSIIRGTSVDWVAIQAGKAVVRLANGQVIRVPIAQKCTANPLGLTCGANS